MTETKVSAKRLAEVAEHATKLTAGALATFYVLGLIAVNLYLANFGFAAFSYARPQYIFTGAWAVLLFVLTMLPAALAAYLLFQDRRSFRAACQSLGALRIHFLPIARLLLGVGVLLLVAPACWYLFFRTTSDKWQWPPFGGAVAILICCAFCCVTFRMLPIAMTTVSGKDGPADIVGVQEQPDRTAFDAGMLIWVAVVALNLLLFLSIFSATTYRVIDPAYGGGKPVRARLVVDASTTPDLVRIGFPMRRSMNVSLPVDIMAESEDEIFIATDVREFRLRKALFKAADLKPFSDDVGWELKDISDLAIAPEQIMSTPDCRKSFLDVVQSQLETFGIPLHQFRDLSWQCGESCYSAADALEETRADQVKHCPQKASTRENPGPK
jgi:hypothetical protein